MTPVRSGRNPFELFMLAACLISGIAGLVAPGHASASVQMLPHWEILAWYASLTLGGGVGIAGAVFGTVDGLLCERAGLCVLAGVSIGEALALIGYGGVRATTGAAFVAMFGLACIARVVTIGADLRAVRRGDP